MLNGAAWGPGQLLVPPPRASTARHSWSNGLSAAIWKRSRATSRRAATVTGYPGSASLRVRSRRITWSIARTSRQAAPQGCRNHPLLGRGPYPRFNTTWPTRCQRWRHSSQGGLATHSATRRCGARLGPRAQSPAPAAPLRFLRL